MTLIRRRTPFRELMSLPQAMDRLFEETFDRPLRWLPFGQTLFPALDVRSTPEEIIVEVALPGVKPEDVDITIDGELLTVRGTFKEEAEKVGETFVYRELERGDFSRTITLPMPAKADQVKATFKNGLLSLTIPKAEEVKPHHVKVESV